MWRRRTYKAFEFILSSKKMRSNSRYALIEEENIDAPNDLEHGENLMLRRTLWNK